MSINCEYKEKENKIVLNVKDKIFNIPMKINYAKRIFGRKIKLKLNKLLKDLFNIDYILINEEEQLYEFIKEIEKGNDYIFNKKEYIEQLSDIIFESNIFNIKRYSDSSKRSGNSIYISQEEMTILIKMIIKIKLSTFALDYINRDNQEIQNIFEFLFSEKEKEIFNKLFKLVKMLVKKSENINPYIYKLFNSKFGFNNIAFMLAMYKKTIIDFFINYDLKADINPIGYVSTFLNNQINWWLREYHSDVRMINEEQKSVADEVFDLNPDCTKDTYQENIILDFVSNINNAFKKMNLSESEIYFFEDDKKLMSVISKVSSCYIFARVFFLDYNQIYDIIRTNNKFHKKMLFLLKYAINKYESDNYDEFLNPNTQFRNMFTILYSYYKKEKEHYCDDDHFYNSMKSRFSRKEFNYTTICKEYFSKENIEEKNKAPMLNILSLVDSEISGSNIHYLYGYPTVMKRVGHKIEQKKLKNLYEDKKCRFFIVDVINYILKREQEYNFASMFNELREIISKFFNEHDVNEENFMEEIKYNHIETKYFDIKIFE
ncbi:MAG: hypothetical protein ACOC3V_00955 [bacterium]